MGLCESERRMNKINDREFMDNNIDSVMFYDVVVNIQSIKDINKGWTVKFNNRILNNNNFIKDKNNEKVLKVGLLGNSNKGKSFIVSKLSHKLLPVNSSIKTEGLSIKFPDLKTNENRKIAFLDSIGLEAPILRKNNEKEKKDKNININRDKEEKDNISFFMEKSKEKLITDLFLQNYIIHNSDIIIAVVGLLTYSEQKLLNRIKLELKEAKLNQPLYIIHNLMTYTTIEQVENYIDDILKKSATFELEEQIKNYDKNESSKGVSFYEKNSNQRVFHLIFANENSKAGKYYNEYTLSFLENSFEKITDLKGFDIINSVKERFKEISKNIIENINGEIEFDDSDNNLIKLKNPKEIILKNFLIDKLEYSNIRTCKFEPRYSYYYNNASKQIIVNVEAPGNCKLASSIQLKGEYIIIKITGNKNDNEKASIINERKFGPFSIAIPLKLTDLIKANEKNNIKEKENDLIIKNQKPRIEKKDGIITIIYQLEENCLEGSLSSNINKIEI